MLKNVTNSFFQYSRVFFGSSLDSFGFFCFCIVSFLTDSGFFSSGFSFNSTTKTSSCFNHKNITWNYYQSSFKIFLEFTFGLLRCNSFSTFSSLCFQSMNSDGETAIAEFFVFFIVHAFKVRLTFNSNVFTLKIQLFKHIKFH